MSMVTFGNAPKALINEYLHFHNMLRLFDVLLFNQK